MLGLGNGNEFGIPNNGVIQSGIGLRTEQQASVQIATPDSSEQLTGASHLQAQRQARLGLSQTLQRLGQPLGAQCLQRSKR